MAYFGQDPARPGQFGNTDNDPGAEKHYCVNFTETQVMYFYPRKQVGLADQCPYQVFSQYQLKANKDQSREVDSCDDCKKNLSVERSVDFFAGDPTLNGPTLGGKKWINGTLTTTGGNFDFCNELNNGGVTSPPNPVSPGEINGSTNSIRIRIRRTFNQCHTVYDSRPLDVDQAFPTINRSSDFPCTELFNVGEGGVFGQLNSVFVHQFFEYHALDGGFFNPAGPTKYRNKMNRIAREIIGGILECLCTLQREPMFSELILQNIISEIQKCSDKYQKQTPLTNGDLEDALDLADDQGYDITEDDYNSWNSEKKSDFNSLAYMLCLHKKATGGGFC